VFPMMGMTLVAVWIVDRVLFGRSIKTAAS
jgi:hypothetical protein